MEDFIIFTKDALSGKGNQDIAWTAITSFYIVSIIVYLKLSFSAYWISLLKRRMAVISTMLETTAWKWVTYKVMQRNPAEKILG